MDSNEWDKVPVTPEHATYLKDSAISPETAISAGTTSITSTEQLPEPFQSYGDKAVPSLVFHHEQTPQLRPDTPIVIGGKPAKYLWPSGHPLVMAERVPVTDTTRTLLIVEGTKQALAAASNAPDHTAVLGMVGCRGWYVDGAPSPTLMLADGLEVVIVLDSDAATNLDVYNAGVKLGAACSLEGASSVKYARLPGSGKSGLDDILATRPPARRRAWLERLIAAAKTKPADTRPKSKGRSETALQLDSERGLVIVNGDRFEAINSLEKSLKERWNGTRLFCYGSVMAQRRGMSMVPVTKGQFNDLVAETCQTVIQSMKDGEACYTHAWPDGQTMEALLSRADNFSALDKLSQIPFIRADGTVCDTPGYDAESRTYLLLDKELEGIEVPADPTPNQIQFAVRLLMDDLLEGFPFPSEGERTNALATLLTPFIRPLVPVSPLAVIDGKEAGSGKNLFADVISLILTGRAAQPLPYTIDDDEQRKVITSAFKSGTNLFIFDEAHKIVGASFARALTSHTYQDRVLGVSTIAAFPNNVTWMALGNQVTVLGDMSRRVYRVRLEYTGESPENRPSTDFKHPDLRGWIVDNRAELVTACLTLVRAWFAAGKPRPKLGFRMGSFERWQETMAGVLETAGRDGFLEGMQEWRSESDYERQNWVSHFRWLQDKFGSEKFTVASVVKALREDRFAETPHGMDNPALEGYARLLGQAYGRQKGRWLDGLRLVRHEGMDRRKVVQWSIDMGDGPHVDGVQGVQGLQGSPKPTHMEKKSFPTAIEKDVSPVGGGCRDACNPCNPCTINWDMLDMPDEWGYKTTACDECGTDLVTFGSAGILRACPSCYPDTVARR